MRVLVLFYSQTGQLGDVMRSVVAGLDQERCDVTVREILPRVSHPFPWSLRGFFGVFPESVLGPAPEIEPLRLGEATFDLVILGMTVWFLAPSLPVRGFFESRDARVLRDTPVMTIIGCRNMWHTASETMKKLIAEAGGMHIDNAVFTDQGPAWATFVTTPRWMFTGRKEAFGFFPAAGIRAEAVSGARRFGEAIWRRRSALAERPPRSLLRGLDAIEVEQRFIVPELIGRLSFPPWARLIRAARRLGNLAAGVVTGMFVIYLVLAILLLVPLSIVARLLLYPLIKRWYDSYAEKLRSPTESRAA